MATVGVVLRSLGDALGRLFYHHHHSLLERRHTHTAQNSLFDAYIVTNHCCLQVVRIVERILADMAANANVSR